MTKLKFFSYISFLALTATASNVAFATYSIKDAMVDARMHNQELKINTEKLNVHELARPKALSGFWPVASAGADISKTESSTLIAGRSLNQSGTSANLTVAQELFAGGRSIAQLKAAESTINAAKAEFDYRNASTFMKVLDAYYGVILARKVYQISVENEAAMKNRLEQISTRFKAGEVTKTDVSMAKAELANALTKREGEFGNMKTAESQFTYIIGVEPEKALSDIDLKKVAIPKTLQEFATIVRQNNLNLKVAKNSVTTARTGISIASSALMPNVSAQISRSNRPISNYLANAADPDQAVYTTTYSLALKVPLFDGSKYIDIKEAKYKARNAELDLANVNGDVEQKIVEVWSQYQTALSNTISVAEAAKAAQEALDGVKQEYNIGTKTTLDLLDSERRLFSAQTDQEKVRSNLVISYFSIKALMGELHNFDFTQL